jgi:glycerol-3-phosphate acyltransferase PlsX
VAEKQPDQSGNGRPRIAVDAMGGDHGPEVTIPGALAALGEGAACELHFYGDQARVDPLLADARDQGLAVSAVHCSQDIDMSESPASAVRGKPDSPIVRAMTDQRAGSVDAVVLAGSTGAMVAASLLILGRLESADRPAIATFVPTVRGETLLVDAGANNQGTPELLLSFARMGSVYCRAMQESESPTVGLLNIGGESSKGSELAVAAHALLRDSELNFSGNVEGNEVMVGACDVLVTDGFTGNIALKMIEGLAQFVKALAASGQLDESELAGLQAFGGVIKRRFNYEVYGGAPLLGVRGVSIICHGRSTPLAFTHAVKVAERQVRVNLPTLIEEALGHGAGTGEKAT